MRSKKFPVLLNKQAKILFNLNRADLALMGGSFLLLSLLKVTGVISLIINLLILVTFKIYIKLTPNNFFKELFSATDLDWKYCIQKLTKDKRRE